MEETKLTLFGGKTPRVKIYKSESHKLHQAFTVAEGSTISEGMPVAIDTDGNIIPYTGTGIYIGIAVTNNTNQAYKGQKDFPVEVTVAVRGYMVVNWTAAASITPGYVKMNASNAAETSSDATNFVALAPAGTGEIVPVLVLN